MCDRSSARHHGTNPHPRARNRWLHSSALPRQSPDLQTQRWSEVVVAYHSTGDTFPIGTLKAMIESAGWQDSDLRRLDLIDQFQAKRLIEVVPGGSRTPYAGLFRAALTGLLLER